MSTKVVLYQAVATPTIDTSLPSVLDIIYIDKNGATQRVNGFAAPKNQWNISFTGTVGQPYSCAAIDRQSGQKVTVTVYEDGSSVTSADNSANTALFAGVTGTI